MFGLFGKSELKKLQKKHKLLLKEAFDLSKIDRKRSDLKYAEANEVEKEMIELEGQK
jgi:hypothetical protein